MLLSLCCPLIVCSVCVQFGFGSEVRGGEVLKERVREERRWEKFGNERGERVKQMNECRELRGGIGYFNDFG